MVSSNTQASSATHSRVVEPTRKPQLGGTISGRCTVQRVLVMPVWAGMRVLGSKIEKNAVGARPSTRQRGTTSSSVRAVTGQRAMWPGNGWLWFHKKYALHLRERFNSLN